MPDSRIWIVSGALLGAVGVMLGAFGAHGLEEFLVDRLDDPGISLADRLVDWDTAVRYHMIHAVALVLVGLVAARGRHIALSIAAAVFVAGIILFSGMLYLRVVSEEGPSGHLVMVGGLCYTAGWLLLAWGGMKATLDE